MLLCSFESQRLDGQIEQIVVGFLNFQKRFGSQQFFTLFRRLSAKIRARSKFALLPNEAHHIFVIGQLFAKCLQQVLAAPFVQIQTNLCKFVQNFVGTRILLDSAPGIEGVHVCELDAVGKQLFNRLSRCSQLYLDVNVGVGRGVRIVFDQSVRNQLVQPFAEIGRPRSDRQFGNRHFVLFNLPNTFYDVVVLCILGNGSPKSSVVGNKLGIQPGSVCQPLQEHRFQIGWIELGNARRISGSNTSASVDQKHGKNGRIPFGLNQKTVVVSIGQAVQIFGGNQR